MKQASFTAKELYAMAYLREKQKMYGVPDTTGSNRSVAIQIALDHLVSHGVAEMDLDGKILLSEEYHSTVDAYCDCQKCLTVSARKEDDSKHSFVFWLCNDCYSMAEVIDSHYVFSPVDADTIAAMVNSLLCSTVTAELPTSATIPQMDIVKAKRACEKGDFTQTVRILRQKGAPQQLADIIAEALRGQTYYLGVSYMDMQMRDCRKTDLSYICSEGVMLALDQTMVNYRTCATFTPISCESMQCEVKSVVHEFVQKGA